MRLLAHLLTRFIQNGTLRVIDAGGTTHVFAGGGRGPDITIRLHNRALERKLFMNPELNAAEAYMEGTLSIENASAHDFLHLFSLNRSSLGQHPAQAALRKVWRALKGRHQHNPAQRAAVNAQHHYDLTTELYALFLDPDLNYSCAFFDNPDDDTLEEAQEAKLRRIAAKLKLESNLRVLDIGCGWGPMSIFMAKNYACRVTAISLAGNQLAEARRRAERAGVSDLIDFRQVDYREVEGEFDRIVSIGMMEHVGVNFFDAYFAKIRDLLTPAGFACIHAIGRMTPPGSTSPFIRKYIFPGGYVPALSEVFSSLERSRMWTCDMEVLRLHYYYTIREWRRRFSANRDQAKALYDERFCRMWEFYLSAVELGFLNGSNMVYQLLLSRERDAVPLARDYMTDEARVLKARTMVGQFAEVDDTEDEDDAA